MNVSYVTQNKIKIYGRNYQEYLYQYIDAEHLPKEL